MNAQNSIGLYFQSKLPIIWTTNVSVTVFPEGSTAE